MRTIWKTKIQPNSKCNGLFAINVPARQGAIPVAVMKQGDDVCVWFEVEPGEPEENLILYCVGTGFGAVPTDCRYVDSVADGPYVWHFYTPTV